MSDDDEQEIKLRDQFAMAAMQALVSQHKVPMATNNTISLNNTANGGQCPTHEYYVEMWIESMQGLKDRINPLIPTITDLAYQIADAMRKSRLKTFT